MLGLIGRRFAAASTLTVTAGVWALVGIGYRQRARGRATKRTTASRGHVPRAARKRTKVSSAHDVCRVRMGTFYSFLESAVMNEQSGDADGDGIVRVITLRTRAGVTRYETPIERAAPGDKAMQI